MRNETIKRIAAAVIFAVIALVSCFGLSGWQSSPETHRASIEYLDQKQSTVMKLTAASTAASAAISALPGDTGSPIADKLADLTSDFLIVLCAIMLEKYLLIITGYAVLRFLLPLALLAGAVNLFWRKELLWKLICRLTLFSLAIWIAVPGGITVSRMIEDTYETSLTQTIDAAQSAADDIEDTANSGTEQSGLWSSITSSVKDAVSGVTEKFENLLNDMLEALAVLIVTSCVIPILVLLFLLWIVKMLTGVEIDIPRRSRSVHTGD